MHGPAEQLADQRTADGQHQHPRRVLRLKQGGGRHRKPGGGHGQPARRPEGGQGTDQAGQQRRLGQKAHVRHFNAEHRRGQGRAEQGAEHRAHSGEDHGLFVLPVQVQGFTQGAAHAAAQLKRSALPPGRASAQVGEGRSGKDQRGQAQGHRLAAAGPLQHQVRARVALPVARQRVQPHDRKARQRQPGQQPGMGRAQRGGLVHTVMEGAAHSAPQKAHGHAQRAPFYKAGSIGAACPDPAPGQGFAPLQNVHRTFPFNARICGLPPQNTTK